MRLIDADALKEVMWRSAVDTREKIAEIIDNAPTVKLDESVIQEVLNKRCMTAVANEYLIAFHGKIPQGEWKGNGIKRICSECGFDVPVSKFELCKYCPNCGADMRGDKNNG